MNELEKNLLDSDEAVVGTNDEATHCKSSAVHKGYYDDTFIQSFCKSTKAKPPEINMGYYIRVYVIKCMIEYFIKLFGQEAQIISLGAGFDTTYWRLMKSQLKFRKYVEIDLPLVVYKKAHIISHNINLQQYLTNIMDLSLNKKNTNVSNNPQGNLKPSYQAHHKSSVTSQDHEIHSDNYDLLSINLRDINMVDKKFLELNDPLNSNFIDFKADSLLKWIVSRFKSTICFLNYEQVNMGDNFGLIMQDNLKNRGCCLLGVDQCLNESSQRNRFLNVGWDSVQVDSILKLFYSMPDLEKHRILNLEFLDEKELLYQLLDHYCLCWACKNVCYENVESKDINKKMQTTISQGTSF
ncbi:unnamed protein product [Gordionus sp. m RMFG-2023]